MRLTFNADVLRDVATHGRTGASGPARLSALRHRLASGWATWRRHRRDVAQLDRLSERELRDFGLSRFDAFSIRHGRFRPD